MTRALTKASRATKNQDRRDRSEGYPPPLSYSERLSPIQSIHADSVGGIDDDTVAQADADRRPNVGEGHAFRSREGIRAPGPRSPLLTRSRHPPARSKSHQLTLGASARSSRHTGYGSISPTPTSDRNQGVSAPFRLPAPALSPTLQQGSNSNAADSTQGGSTTIAGPSHKTRQALTHACQHHSYAQPSTPRAGSSQRPSILKRMMSIGIPQSPALSDVPLENYHIVEAREQEFFVFLNEQLEKIELFYDSKEKDASQRLEALEDQLREMKDRRVDEVLALEQKLTSANPGQRQSSNDVSDTTHGNSPNGNSLMWKNPLGVVDRWRHGRVGANTRALKTLASPGHGESPDRNASNLDTRRDFTRRMTQHDVPYRVAKRKLKMALQEFYRGLELLKSYALFNRTAFRKINKKYDKAVSGKHGSEYMSRRVNGAHFVQSELLDNFIVTVENLYAQYFEKGNHKVAVNKLRNKLGRSEFHGSVFRNGLLLAAGAVLGIEALVTSRYLWNHTRPGEIETQNTISFLLQLYGGYFLALFLYLLYCFDCRIWTQAKVNYAFVFEFDTRHHLDWRQLSEIPCLLFFLQGLIMWLNFQLSNADENFHIPVSRSRPVLHPMFVYWPVVLVGLSLAIICLPFKTLFYRSRLWFAYSNFRLVLAGIYPVEFRDFFLGDMFCSLTYAMGNIEVFFCAYARRWQRVDQCNSSHSQLLGFFSCLPGIWRALQCLRRYYDTRRVFPHLVNCGKYTCTILFYMSLSIYRVNRSGPLKALFITFATANSVYVCR